MSFLLDLSVSLGRLDVMKARMREVIQVSIGSSASQVSSASLTVALPFFGELPPPSRA
jgi:hypothetical protein